MSNLSTPSPAPAPVRSTLPRKVSILFLLVTDAVLGLALWFNLKSATPLALQNIFADMTLGLVAGFGTRVFLRNRAWAVRFLAGTAALIIGLLILGVLTNWRAGFGPLKFWRDTIDWIGLAHISIGTVTLLLAMQAWSKPIRVSPKTTPAAAPPPRGTIRPAVKAKRKKLKQPGLSITSSRNKPVQAKPYAKPIITAKSLAQPVSKPKRSLFRRKPQVHLSKIERHLCPYCLDPVTRNDSRGVVECDVCHTLHHGDCWAIAGVCQVPHYNS